MIKEDLSAVRDELYEFRHDLHRHPELSGQERRTARRIREELAKIGLRWRAVGGTGTLAELTGASPGPTILLRADIDALPVQEASSFPFPSEESGVMHACGHDIHTAALLGAARLLASRRESLHGTVRFVFQQAEEIGHGSQYFLRENVTDGAERIYGFHVTPDAPLGSVILTDGTDAASCDHMLVRLRGKGAHIAKPHLGRDALLAAADLTLHLRGLPGRLDPLESILVGVGRISAGNAWNVIADCAEIEGTVRALSASSRKAALSAVQETVRSVAALYGVEAETEFEQNTTCLVNDPRAYETMYQAALQTVGSADRIVRRAVPLGFGGDDFAAFAERIPGCFIHVGTARDGNPDTALPLHSGRIVIDDGAIDVGCEILIRCALAHLKRGERP